jgi:hypothetical protein
LPVSTHRSRLSVAAWWARIVITRIADGKIAEDWWMDDGLTFYQQVGAIASHTR